MRIRGKTSVWITLIITCGILLIGETLILVENPSANGAIINDASILAALAVSTTATLRGIIRNTEATQETKEKIDKHTEVLTTIAENVNGNLSTLIDFAKEKGFTDEELADIKRNRNLLIKLIEANKDKTFSADITRHDKQKKGPYT